MRGRWTLQVCPAGRGVLPPLELTLAGLPLALIMRTSTFTCEVPTPLSPAACGVSGFSCAASPTDPYPGAEICSARLREGRPYQTRIGVVVARGGAGAGQRCHGQGGRGMAMSQSRP